MMKWILIRDGPCTSNSGGGHGYHKNLGLSINLEKIQANSIYDRIFKRWQIFATNYIDSM